MPLFIFERWLISHSTLFIDILSPHVPSLERMLTLQSRSYEWSLFLACLPFEVDRQWRLFTLHRHWRFSAWSRKKKLGKQWSYIVILNVIFVFSAASVMILVVPVGEALAVVFMEYFGRVNAVKLSLIPYVVGCALLAIANGFPLIMAGRVLMGLSLGK